MANVLRLGVIPERVASAEEVGAKAANIDRIARLGIPVPPAFVLPVNLCARIVAGETLAEEEMRGWACRGHHLSRICDWPALWRPSATPSCFSALGCCAFHAGYA